LAPWTSDAQFLYFGRIGTEQTLIICNATKLEVGGKPIFASVEPILRCEIIRSNGGTEVVCPREDVKPNSEAIESAFKPFESMREPAVSEGAKH